MATQSRTGQILLPEITPPPIKTRIGKIHHCIRLGENVNIESSEERVVRRRSEKIYSLSNGEKIIITSRRLLELPDNIDGILQEDVAGKVKWLKHREIDTFISTIAAGTFEENQITIAKSWRGQLHYRAEEANSEGQIVSTGLRPPQLGALHAIGAHWSLHNKPATIVMPTGTGKTETMLATLIAYQAGKIIIVVPSKVLRDQTARKFIYLGLLRKLGVVDFSIKNPIVGVIEKRAATAADLSILDKCNVVVSTMSALTGSTVAPLIDEIVNRIGTLIVDEAHHIAAEGWSNFREKFHSKHILQFTATPYRRDGKLVDGKVVYDYPLATAQKDGYFKKIKFTPVYEIDSVLGDEAIATRTIEQLTTDLNNGLDHLVMARCDSINRARDIFSIYERLGSDYNPVLIHSESGTPSGQLQQVNERRSRIIVCVDMLGEGFDLPQLKIAALHDTHKSLAILLQFTGRFTRSSATNIGDATVIANIANQQVSTALERLYSEDADWNQLLSEFSSQAARSHSELIDFLNSSIRLDDDNEDDKLQISHSLLKPTFSTLLFNARSFTPRRFFEGIPARVEIRRVWLNETTKTLFFVTRQDYPIKWTRSHELYDREWNLHILHYDESQELLYLASSDKESDLVPLANSVGATSLISGDSIFRCLGNINRLVFQNVGVKKHGRRNLRYALYTGADVAQALSISESAGSVKSNLSGNGWENGEPVTIGCSYKGRVWSKEGGTIPELISWLDIVGKKIKDDTIDTSQIISNVLIPEEVTELPDKIVLGIDWPIEILKYTEEKIQFTKSDVQKAISEFNLKIIGYDRASNSVDFEIQTEQDSWATYRMIVGGNEGFRILRISQAPITITAGKFSKPVEEYFSDYPPLVRYVDLSELDGNLLIRPQNPHELDLPSSRFEAWDWTGVDITKESIWKDGRARNDSIQWKAAEIFASASFDIVFDDDAAGEAADLICLKEEIDHIKLVLIHCKFTSSSEAGERVKDAVEVCSQAIRSAKWKWRFRDLCLHMIERERKVTGTARNTRFRIGNSSNLNRIVKASRFKEIKPQIIIVQPGISISRHTPDQKMVLAAAYNYLKETIGVDLDIICSE